MKCADKIRYKTRATAMKVIGQRSRIRGVKLYTYPCWACAGFHVTRFPLSEYLRRASDEEFRHAVEAYGREIAQDAVRVAVDAMMDDIRWLRAHKDIEPAT